MPQSVAIQINQVSKKFNQHKDEVIALDNVSVDIRENEFFTLLGPSGCGKTTLLRLIAGFEHTTGGDILLKGKPIAHLPPYLRLVNTVFQSYALFPHMTVAENIGFGLLMQDKPADEIDATVSEMLQLVQMEALRDRRTDQISGGQQQRVALARAVVNRPALLLLDEPLGALDLKLRRQMQLELKDIQSEVGLTFLHVTHDQEEAMTMADTVAVMNQGRIEQMGAPEELYESPQTAFVATFLGQSNLFGGEVTGTTANVVSVSASGYELRVPSDRAVAHRGVVTVGIRPEKVTLHSTKPTAGSNETIVGPGRVLDASFSGVSIQYLVDVPGLGEITVFAQNTSLGEHAKNGDEVYLSWQVAHAFGLADAPPQEERFQSDTDTQSVAVQEREKLEAELEES